MITRRVVELSRRSFNHRIEAASPEGYQARQLSRLNRDLDSLYELIYDDWTTITEDDYRMFGGQLELLIQTVKQLYDTCRRFPKAAGLRDETIKLGMNYSALYELNSDIVNFCIKLPKNEEMKRLMNRLAEVDARQEKTVYA